MNNMHIDVKIFLFLEPVAIKYNYETLLTDSLQLKGHRIRAYSMHCVEHLMVCYSALQKLCSNRCME